MYGLTTGGLSCAQLGLMVLHDFMFACSLYPTTKAFLQNVEKEVQYQLVSARASIGSHPLPPLTPLSRAAAIEPTLQHCAVVWQQRKRRGARLLGGVTEQQVPGKRKDLWKLAWFLLPADLTFLATSCRDLYVCDYFKLYYDTVHATYALEDPHGTIPFWPSSPSNGMHKWGKVRALHGSSVYLEGTLVRNIFHTQVFSRVSVWYPGRRPQQR